MTRRDFVLIAAILKSEKQLQTPTDKWSQGASDEWSTIVLAFAKALADTNPTFDRARFLEACGMA